MTMTLKWYLLWFKYPVDDVLDQQIANLLDLEVEKLLSSEDANWLYICFSNGTQLKIWNRGKYRAWMSRGEIQSAGGEFQYSWRKGRAKRKNMYRLVLKIQQLSDQVI